MKKVRITFDVDLDTFSLVLTEGYISGDTLKLLGFASALGIIIFNINTERSKHSAKEVFKVLGIDNVSRVEL